MAAPKMAGVRKARKRDQYKKKARPPAAAGPGPHYHYNRLAADRGERALQRHLQRGGPAVEPEPLEETPFGQVTCSSAPRHDYRAANPKLKATYVSTNQANYPLSSGKFATYTQLASRLTPEMARDVLIEVYETLRQAVDPEIRETAAGRQRRCRGQRSQYREKWNDNERRAMAAYYALALYSEEQRTGGGKAMRGALRRVAAGKATAIQVFGTDAPDWPQAKSLEYRRRIQAGHEKANKRQKALRKDISESSEEDDDGTSRASAYARAAEELRGKKRSRRTARLAAPAGPARKLRRTAAGRRPVPSADDD